MSFIYGVSLWKKKKCISQNTPVFFYTDKKIVTDIAILHDVATKNL